MEVYCTRPGCPRPQNYFSDLDDSSMLKTVQQKFCTTCGMPLILSGRYLPVRLLGQGGFGAAFLARDRYTPAMRQCVAKLLQPSISLTPAQLKIAQTLFEREAAVLEELGNEHSQIPSLLAFFELTVPSLHGKNEQFFYLVQEFIDGHNLEEELAVKGKFSEDETMEVLREILKVLDFVHSRGSIHRDIKPANIMRAKNGRLYLLDFGAVKQVTQTVGTSKASTGIYSLGYAPPEQMTGQEVYPATDLYALGVTCITLLSGLQPTDLFDSYKNEWNWHSRVEISSRLTEVLDRMLLSAPSQRFQSATEVEAALKPESQRPTVVAAPPQIATKPPQTPTVYPPKPQTPQPPTVIPGTVPGGLQASPRGTFSIWEVLGGAAFTGFEGGLLAIALTSLLPSPGLSMGLLGMIVGGLIYGQYRRSIEQTEMLIIGAGTFAMLWFFPVLRSAAIGIYGGSPIAGVLFVGWLAALGAIAVTAIFRLIYKLLSNVF